MTNNTYFHLEQKLFVVPRGRVVCFALVDPSGLSNVCKTLRIFSEDLFSILVLAGDFKVVQQYFESGRIIWVNGGNQFTSGRFGV